MWFDFFFKIIFYISLRSLMLCAAARVGHRVYVNTQFHVYTRHQHITIFEIFLKIGSDIFFSFISTSNNMPLRDYDAIVRLIYPYPQSIILLTSYARNHTLYSEIIDIRGLLANELFFSTTIFFHSTFGCSGFWLIALHSSQNLNAYDNEMQHTIRSSTRKSNTRYRFTLQSVQRMSYANEKQ